MNEIIKDSKPVSHLVTFIAQIKSTVLSEYTTSQLFKAFCTEVSPHDAMFSTPVGKSTVNELVGLSTSVLLKTMQSYNKEAQTLAMSEDIGTVDPKEVFLVQLKLRIIIACMDIVAQAKEAAQDTARLAENVAKAMAEKSKRDNTKYSDMSDDELDKFITDNQ